MNRGKRLIAGMLAALLTVQGVGATDFTLIGSQKVFADTINQPVNKSNVKKAESKEKQTASLVTLDSETTPKSNNSSNIVRLSGGSRTKTADAGSYRTNKNLQPISYSNYSESDTSLPYTQQKTSDKPNDLPVFTAGGTTEAETADTVPSDIQETLTPAAISIPSNVNVTATDTTLTVSWDAVSDAQSYDVSLDGTVTNVTAASYTYSSLVPNSQHIVKVRAVSSEGIYSDWTQEAAVYTTLNVPQSLIATPSAIAIDLAWNSVLAAASYDIEHDGQVTSDITQTTYTLTALAPGTQHLIRVRAKNANGIGSWGEMVSVYTLLNTPLNVKATATTTALTVNWDAVNNATNYDIELNGTVVQSSEQNNCVVSGLTPETQFKIRIKAKNNITGSDWSSEFSITTLASTSASGYISRNTTWTAANSPYILNGSLTIPSGVTLTVEPGVVVKSANYSNVIDVRGKLVALGTTGSAIVFTTCKDIEYGGSGVTTSVDYWGGINVAASGEFVGDYVKVRYGAGDKSNNSGTLNVSGKLMLANSEISKSRAYGMTLNNVKEVTLRGSKLEESGYYGIYIDSTASSPMVIEDNIISRNKYGGIEFSRYGTGSLSVKNNNIINNGFYPIYIYMNGMMSSIFSGIQNNTYTGNEYNGILLYGRPTIDSTICKGDYYISDSIAIPSGVTLTVEPGVIVRSRNDYTIIDVQGKLNAIGTADKPIVFTTYKDPAYGGSGVITSTDSWGGIKVSQTGGVTGDYVKVRYGASDKSNNAGALNVEGKLSLTNSEISKSRAHGMFLRNIKDVTLRGSKIEESGYYGIYTDSTAPSPMVIEDNSISRNKYGGIEFSRYGTGSLSVKNNNIINNGFYPIYIYMNGMMSSIFSGIQNNTYTGNEYNGILLYGRPTIDSTICKGDYYISDSIAIPSGVTLTVEPGVIVKSRNDYTIIDVQGKLNAIGTADKPIVFTTYKDLVYGGSGVTTSSDSWGGIKVSQTGEFTGDYVKVRYGASDKSNNAGALNVEGKLSLTNSEISKSRAHGMFLRNIKDVTLRGSKIEESGYYGIYTDSTAPSPMVIEDNSISRNKYGGIEFSRYGTGSLSVKNNNIINNGFYPIYIYMNGMMSSIFSGIQNNTYTGNEYNGILLYGRPTIDSTICKGDYYISDSIAIPSGVKLTVEPGVIVKSRNDYTIIDVQGKLNAIGTADKPIVFTTYKDPAYGGSGVITSTDYWGGIKVSETGEFTGDYVNVRCGDSDKSNNAGTLNVGGKLTLTNSEINNSYGHSIYFNTATAPILLYNTFSGNSSGMYNAKSSTTTIDARFNYWGSYYGPSVYRYFTENNRTYGAWCGEGDKVNDGITYAPYLGSEMNHKFYFGQSGINSATGNYSRTYTDLTVASPGFDIAFSRTYNSQNDKATSLGKGWTFSYEGSVKDEEYTYVDFLDGTTKTAVNSNIKAVTLPDGKVLSFSVNTDGTYTANNSRYTLKKQANGTFILTAKDQSAYFFNPDGYLVKMQDRNGNAVALNVDSSGKVHGVTDQVGRHFTIIYENGLIKNITDDASNRTVTYDYTNSRLTKVTDPMGNPTSYAYDSEGFVTEVRDSANKLIEAVTYIHSGENKDKVNNITDANGNVLTYSYDNTNRRTTITDSKGRTTRQAYDSSYSITESTDAGAKTSIYEYSKESGINKYAEETSVKDRNGNTTKYDRDGKGNITKITNPDLTTKVMTYDSNNNLTSEKDESDKYTFYIYDSEGKNIEKKVQPLNGTDKYEEGKSTDSNYAITRYHYYTDAECLIKGLLEAETDPEENITAYTYDAYGNIKTVKDAENNITTFEYNPAGEITKKTTAKGNVTSYIYDKNGNLEKQIQDGNKVTRITYDSENRKTKEVSPKQYNSAADDIANHKYTDDSGSRYTYYAGGKVQTVTDSENHTTSYTYDICGNLETQTNPNGSIYSYEYDSMDRPVKKYFQDNQASEKVLLEEYSYEILTDSKTKKTQKQYLNSTDVAITVYTYDYANRLISQKNPDNTTISTNYNPNGTVESTKDEKENKTYYKYDGLNRLTEQWTPFETVSGAVRYSYSKIIYDKAGRKKNEIVGKDTVTLYAAALQLITKTYDYYNNGKVKSITDNEGRKTEYQYDADGNVSKETVYTSATDKNINEYENNYLGKVSEKKVHVKAGDIAGNDFNSTEDGILKTVYTYDKNGNLETVTTHDNVTTTYIYDNLNRQKGVSQPGIDEDNHAAIIASSTEYDSMGNVVKTTDAKGNETLHKYSQRGLLEETTDAATNTTAFYYDRAGRKTAEVEPKDYDPAKTLDQMNRVEYTYDLMGRVKTKTYVGEEKKIDSATHEWTTQQVSIVQKAYQYDNNGNVTKELDGLGLETATDKTSIDTQIATGYGTEYTYNLADKPVTVRDAVSKDRGLSFTTKYTYDALGRKTSETTAKGVIKNYSYNDAGKVTKITVQETSGSAEKTIQTNTYDYTGNLLTQKDGNGNITTYEYNAFGKLRKTTAPTDTTIPVSTITNQYDVMGRLKMQKDTKGAVNTYTYNNQGDVLSQTQQAEDGTQAITTSTRYDKNGNARYVTDGNGYTTENIYNALNKIAVSKLAVSGVMHETSYGYDANGNQTTVTDWRGNTSQNVYDSLNRLIEKKDAYNKSIQKLEYKHSNVQEKSYDALNNLTQYAYDNNNRLLSTIDPQNHKTSQTYDNAGNIQTKTDGKNNVTTYTYDELNRLKTVTNAKNETTVYEYDLNGNLLTQTDGKRNITTYEYNAANKAAKRIDQGGRTENYTYYSDGSLKTKTDRKNITTTYIYDIHGRMLSQTTGNISISYTYDDNGNQLTMTDSTGTTTRTYDEQNRVLTKNVPNIGTTTFQYDKITGIEEGCQAETSTDPKGNITQKTYDRAGRLKTVTADGKTTTYNYYDNGARQNVIYNGGSREDYTYYADGLLWTLTNKKADGSIIDTYSYTYDAAHNQTSKADEKGTTNYTYDTLNRLETVTEPNNTKKTTYTYDTAGDRETEKIEVGGNVTLNTYTYNEQNRLTQIITTINGTTTATTVYTYDNNGSQLTTEVNGAVTVLNAYDARNQLISTTTGGITVQNTYNGDGYRVEKTVNGAITRYLYEYDKVVLELDGTGNQTGRNVYGTNLLMRSADGTTYYYMYNGHADVTALLKPDGTIAATYYYDAFGNITDTTGAASNTITFAGYQYDKETGLYYLNARMYDPKTARFLQEDTYTGDRNDPLSLNLYTYCANNPIIYSDPTGHNWITDRWDDVKKLGKKVGNDLSNGAEWVADKASDAWDTTKKAINDNVIKPVVKIGKDISSAYSTYKKMSTEEKKKFRKINNKVLNSTNSWAAGFDNLMLSWEDFNQEMEQNQKSFNKNGIYIGDPIKNNIGGGGYKSLSKVVTNTYNTLTNPFELYDTFKSLAAVSNPNMTQEKLMYQTSIGLSVYNKINEFNNADFYTKVYMGTEAIADGAQIVAPFIPKWLKAFRGFEVEEVLSLSEGTSTTTRTLNTYGDALRDTLGSAKSSHPEELSAILKHAEESGIGIEFREGTLAYEPSLSSGKPGRLILDQDASIGAVRHEYRHMLDDMAQGHPGFKLIADSDAFWKLEYRGYMEEINLARQLKDYDAGKFILNEMRARRMEILGR